MSRHLAPLLAALGLATPPFAARAAVVPDGPSQRPNFIFFITDDISPDDLGVYGNPAIQTPNLERIAARGLVFDNAYLTISSCSPSRCSIITGRYPHNQGAPELHTSLPPAQHTFVQTLRHAGYHTVISGKNHMAKPAQLGFDVASDSGPSGAENWLKHLRERPKDKPFFCWFASHDAHHPFQFTGDAPRHQAADMRVPPMLHDGPLTRAELAKHAHEVSRTDHFAGELVKELEAQGVAGNTFFIYCSDNGRPFPRCKTYLYDSGIKTPLIVTGPGVATGHTGSLVSSIDFSATILELAGLPKPESVQGASFVPVLRDPAAVTRDVAFAERNWHVYQNHARAVRSGDWLYVWNAWPDRHNLSGESSWFSFPAAKELWEAAEQGKLTPAQALLTLPKQPAEMLFDVKHDPHQFDNLAAKPEHAETLARLRGLLVQWQRETGDSVPRNPTPDRQGLHESKEQAKLVRGEFPGAERHATGINHPGPVLLDRPDPATAAPPAASSAAIPAPPFADPNYHNSCDPEVAWNPATTEWLVDHTARRAIRHYTGPLSDPVDGWKFADTPGFPQPDPIDLTVARVGHEFRAWFRVGDDGGIQWATSRDLVNWQHRGKCAGDVNGSNRGFGYQEAPHVFRFAESWWMLTDPHRGLAVYQSDDALRWNFQGLILDHPGTRPQDHTLGRHASVAFHGDRAFLFCHVEPDRPHPSPPAEQRTVEQKISFLQVAELKVAAGRLRCDHNAQVLGAM